jgi:hypothetical protein
LDRMRYGATRGSVGELIKAEISVGAGGWSKETDSG